ncbi:hypothetical protein [Bdellovibrio bacteriovorus]|uniref:hypothetical protein n=1 Tax=Bdellovibrio bacteriovorus TaxID=959 RepID=UPI0035A5EEB9
MKKLCLVFLLLGSCTSKPPITKLRKFTSVQLGLSMKEFLLLLLLLSGCATKTQMVKPTKFTSEPCEQSFFKGAFAKPHLQLNEISSMFSMGCFNEVITLGSYVRANHRDKFYQITTEVAEIAFPEGYLTDYTLESYERSYLSLLISLSYLNLSNEDASLVELRQSMMDEQAHLYNHGNDPVITTLHAAIWDRFDPQVARPYWKRLSEDKSVHASISKFAKGRLYEIDKSSTSKRAWKIYGVGTMPPIFWQSDLIKREKGPYKIRAARGFPKACSSTASMLIPTSSWTDKLSRRYEMEYHPLLYTKSILRIPFGITYGVLGVGAGVAVGVSGCVLASQFRSGDMCQAAISGGGEIIKSSGNLVQYTLGPDLRHWENVPSAFYIVDEAMPESSPCLNHNEKENMVLRALSR